MLPVLPIEVPPLTPDQEEGLRWATEELSKAKYNNTPGLLTRLLNWLGKKLFERGITDLTSTGSILWTMLIVAVISVLVFLYFKLSGRIGKGSVGGGKAARERQMLFDDLRGSKELFSAADRFLREGNLDMAVVERYRGVIRLLDERGHLLVRPGMTATEAALAGASSTGVSQLYGFAALFNSILFSDGHATPADVDASAQLVAAVRAVPASTTDAINELVRA